MAAARCSDSQLLAVPGSPISNRARSVARVAMAISTTRSLPRDLGVMGLGPALPPQIYARAGRRRMVPVLPSVERAASGVEVLDLVAGALAIISLHASRCLHVYRQDYVLFLHAELSCRCHVVNARSLKS